jgi:hypothetical protein
LGDIFCGVVDNVQHQKLMSNHSCTYHQTRADLSFNPDPAYPPVARSTTHAPITIGFDITTCCPPPCPIFDPASSDVPKILTANADSHQQKYEKKKRRSSDATTKPTQQRASPTSATQSLAASLTKT